MFQFQLNTLLRLRQATRDERRAHLAEAQQVAAVLAERRQSIEERLTAARQGRVIRQGMVNVDALLASQRYEVALRQEQLEVDRQQNIVAQEIERRHGLLVEADRELKVLEKLRERQQAAWQAAEDHRQTQLFDEAALRAHTRREVLQ